MKSVGRAKTDVVSPAHVPPLRLEAFETLLDTSSASTQHSHGNITRAHDTRCAHSSSCRRVFPVV